MRIVFVLSFLLVAGCAARGSDVYRYEVDRGSDLEKELGYKLSVQDERDEQRSEDLDSVSPIEGAAPNYTVKFHATVADKLRDVFELDLTLNDANGVLVQDLISQAVLAIRRVLWASMHPETSYAIRLGDYAPGYKPTETQRIAELRKKHPGMGLLAWHRSKNPPDYSGSLTALTVAQRLFAETNFIGISRAGVATLPGPPDPEPSSSPSSVTYTFGNGEQFVIRRFHFDSKGEVENVEKLLSQ